MKLHELKPAEGSRHNRKRIGRGIGSGHGKTATKGHKGQNARSGGGVRLGFEGGQTPLFRRLPKRGFTNPTRTEFAIVNLTTLNQFAEGTNITPELLIEKKIIKDAKAGIKVLAKGKIEKKFSVRAHKFSEAAKTAIEAAGGSTEVI